MTNHHPTDDELRALPPLVGIRTAAESLGLAYQSALRLIARDDFPLPIVTVGDRRKVRRSDLLKFLSIFETTDITTNDGVSQQLDEEL